MTMIPEALRQLVAERAQGRCEYCLMHQNFSIYTHEVDHIIAVKHGGLTVSENLALSCLPCNRHKGSDFATLDLATGEVVLLYNPRRQVWAEHFRLHQNRIEGLTPIGVATSRLLQFNKPIRILERQTLMNQTLYP